MAMGCQADVQGSVLMVGVFMVIMFFRGGGLFFHLHTQIVSCPLSNHHPCFLGGCGSCRVQQAWLHSTGVVPGSFREFLQPEQGRCPHRCILYSCEMLQRCVPCLSLQKPDKTRCRILFDSFPSTLGLTDEVQVFYRRYFSSTPSGATWGVGRSASVSRRRPSIADAFVTQPWPARPNAPRPPPHPAERTRSVVRSRLTSQFSQLVENDENKKTT